MDESASSSPVASEIIRRASELRSFYTAWRTKVSGQPLLWTPQHKEDETQEEFKRAHADEISPGLWIGNAEAAQLYAKWGFTAILNLAPSMPAVYPPGVVYMKMGISDAFLLPVELLEPKLREGTIWALKQLQERHQLLIHCEEGGKRAGKLALTLMSVLYPESSIGELVNWIRGIRRIQIPPAMLIPIAERLRDSVFSAPLVEVTRNKFDPAGPRTRIMFNLRELLQETLNFYQAMHAYIAAERAEMDPSRSNDEPVVIVKDQYPENPIVLEDFPPMPRYLHSFRDRIEIAFSKAYSALRKSLDPGAFIDLAVRESGSWIEIVLQQIGGEHNGAWHIIRFQGNRPESLSTSA